MRTKFDVFKNRLECEKDKNNLHKLNEKIFQQIPVHIVHVDNPPTHIYVNNGDDDDIYNGDDDDTIKNNKKRRLKSRTKLLDHLENVCSKEEYYKLEIWDKLYEPKSFEKLAEDDPVLSKIIKKKKSLLTFFKIDKLKMT